MPEEFLIKWLNLWTEEYRLRDQLTWLEHSDLRATDATIARNVNLLMHGVMHHREHQPEY